jgi:hypothetical protein
VNVQLSSSNEEAAIPSPSRITIAANATTSSFRIPTFWIEFDTRVNIRAFYDGVESLVEGESQRTRTITVRREPIDRPGPPHPF